MTGVISLGRSLIEGRRFKRSHELYTRDQRQQGRPVVQPQTSPPPVPYIRADRIDQLQRIARIHSQDPFDFRRCLAPSCMDRYPCHHRRVAVAELVAHDITVWSPDR